MTPENKARRQIVAHEAGTYFYRENAGPAPKRVVIDLSPIDWLLLSRQKLALLEHTHDDPGNILTGLVELIDHIQDKADRQGHPVIWSTDEPEEYELEDQIENTTFEEDSHGE